LKTTKIVLIGAGSMSFGMCVFRDMFTCKELHGSTLSLVDIDKENLDMMYEMAVKMNETAGANVKIERTTDRREALSGAEFVINSIAIERCKLWKYDFEIPKKYGIRHCLGENGGPGGLFFSMRTIPLIMDIIRDMEELCPNAYFLNFSNPESRIILALGRYSRIKAVGLCHGVYMGRHDVAKILGMDEKKIDVWAAGLNHFQWFLNIRDKETCEDLYPALREKEKAFDPGFMPLSRKMMKAFGCWPSCSDDNIGEYLAYGWEGGEHGYDFAGDENYRVNIKKDYTERLAGKKGVEDLLVRTDERAIDVVTAILYNKKSFIESGIVYNQRAIANLPADLAVEVPIMVDNGGIHPVRIGNLPDAIAKLCTVQAGVQQMSVDAAVNGSKEMALQALLIDPVITSTDAAEKLLEELWEINKPYIRKCI